MISFTVNQEIRIIFTDFSLALHANPRRARIRSEYPQGDSNNREDAGTEPDSSGLSG
jgi:hypothetical protein